MRKTALIALAALSMAAGCAKDDNGQTKTQDAPCEGATCADKVTAEQAGAYYSQFYYASVKCDDPALDPKTARFTWASLQDRIVVAKAADNNDIVAELELFIDKDGTYTGVYQENVQKLLPPGYWQTVRVQTKRAIAGTWTLKDKNIELSNLGVAKASMVNNWPGFTIDKAQTDLNPILNGKSLSMAVTRSTVSKDLKTVAQVCGGGH